MPNLYATPDNARRPFAGNADDARALHDAVCVLDDYADDLAAVGCNPERVDRVRAIADALTNTYWPCRRAEAPEVSDIDLSLVCEASALLRRRAASATAQRLQRVDLSPAYADALGTLLERLVRLYEHQREASAEHAPGREARRA